MELARGTVGTEVGTERSRQVGVTDLLLELVGSTVGAWCRRNARQEEDRELLEQVGTTDWMLWLVGGIVGASCRWSVGTSEGIELLGSAGMAG